MAKPTHVPVWATAAVYATSADPSAVGQPTKTDPAAIAAQGWDYATRPDPTFLNYWKNEVGAWLGWVSSFTADTSPAGGVRLQSQSIDVGSGIFFVSDDGATIGIGAAGVEVDINGNIILTGVTAKLTGTVGSEIELQSGATLDLQSGSTIVGSPNFNGVTWTWAKPQIVEDTTITLSGSGHIRHKPFALNNTGAQTVGIANGDRFSIPFLSDTLAIALSTTGAGTGTEMTFEAHNNISSGFSAQVTTAEATYLMRADTGGTYYSSLTVYFYGGAWHTLHAVKVP